MTEPSPIQTIEAMAEVDAWALLRAQTVGRLVVNVGSQPDIFPVNYALDEDTIVVRTAEGTKLAAALMGGRVAFEIDHVDENERIGWSVVVHGEARESRRLPDVMHDEALPLEPWASGEKHRVIHITPTRISGRRLAPTSESGSSPVVASPVDAAAQETVR